MTTNELGRRVHDDVCAPLERTNKPRRRDGVVNDERNAGLVRNFRNTFNVKHVVTRVTNSLAVERLGVRTDRTAPFVEIVRIFDERCIDAELRKRVVKKVVSAAVERC